MAAFFFLSGHFSSHALAKRGPVSFLKTKLLKLGVPTVVYTLLGGPFQMVCWGFWMERGGNRDCLGRIGEKLEEWEDPFGIRPFFSFSIQLLPSFQTTSSQIWFPSSISTSFTSRYQVKLSVKSNLPPWESVDAVKFTARLSTTIRLFIFPRLQAPVTENPSHELAKKWSCSR